MTEVAGRGSEWQRETEFRREFDAWERVEERETGSGNECGAWGRVTPRERESGW